MTIEQYLHTGQTRTSWLSIQLVLQPFQVATVRTLVYSTALENSVVGGLLLRTLHYLPGTGTCTTTAAMSARLAAISSMDILCVALKTETGSNAFT